MARKMHNPLSNRYCLPTIAKMKKIAANLSYWNIPGCWKHEMEKSGIAFKFIYDIPCKYSQVVNTRDLQVWTWSDSWVHYIIKGSPDRCMAYMEEIEQEYASGFFTRFEKAPNDMWSGSHTLICD